MFEKFLQDVFACTYAGLDDDMPDSFEAWISALEPADLIMYANRALDEYAEKAWMYDDLCK